MEKESNLSIYDIPLTEIEQFLLGNHITTDLEETELHELAEELINSGTAEYIPIAVTDFIIAKNLHSHNIKKYDLSYIMLADDENLADLANDLTLEIVEKDRIIDILAYLGKLHDDLVIFDKLPNEVLTTILESLDYNALIYMSDIHSKSKKIVDSEPFKIILQQKYQEYYNTSPDERLRVSNVQGADNGGQFRIFD